MRRAAFTPSGELLCQYCHKPWVDRDPRSEAIQDALEGKLDHVPGFKPPKFKAGCTRCGTEAVTSSAEHAILYRIARDLGTRFPYAKLQQTGGMCSAVYVVGQEEDIDPEGELRIYYSIFVIDEEEIDGETYCASTVDLPEKQPIIVAFNVDEEAEDLISGELDTDDIAKAIAAHVAKRQKRSRGKLYKITKTITVQAIYWSKNGRTPDPHDAGSALETEASDIAWRHHEAELITSEQQIGFSLRDSHPFGNPDSIATVAEAFKITLGLPLEGGNRD